MATVHDASALGALIRARRVARGLTQTQLAEMCRSSLRFITELERGVRTEASLSKVLLICRRLALEIDVRPRGDA